MVLKIFFCCDLSGLRATFTTLVLANADQALLPARNDAHSIETIPLNNRGMVCIIIKNESHWK